MRILIALLLAVLCTVPSGVTRAKPRSLSPPQTRETWRSVRTNNLFVIGNADPEKLRQVATWLEFFHTAFARLISRNVIDASVPTTVIIFRDDASFVPFKPLYQGRPANISGFFQPGEDVNYIAIALDPNDKDPYSTAFHEYVHLHLRDNMPGAPLWLNEGLAELYGSLQFSGGDALLGAPIVPYVQLLSHTNLLPLTTLFSIGTNSPHYNEQDKSGVFYGQSWALVHYLMLGDGNRQEQFKRFMQQVSRGEGTAKAIQDSFGMSLSTLEQELESYVRRANFTAQRIARVDNAQAYASYTAMQRSSLSEGEANYYLGDLLMHIGRDSDAERYFKQALAMDPNYAPANASLGLLYVQQRRYADAKKYLQKATSSPQSYLIHYLYAYVLSREGVSPAGLITEYSRENAALMREQLLRSIKLAADYAPAPHLLALVDLVTEEHLDEAVEMARKACELAPSKMSYQLLLAQIHVARGDIAAARPILGLLARDSDQSVKKEALNLLDSLNNTRTGTRRASTPAINTAMIAEPAATTTSRMLGGDSSGVAIRDGQTIDSSGSLPSLDQLLQKYVEAIGGAAAFSAVTSTVIKGTVDLVGVRRGDSLEIYAQAPNKILRVMQIPSARTVKVGFNGRSGWSLSPEGLRVLKGLELASIQRDADFYGPLKLKSLYAKASVAGRSKIGYRNVYVIELQPAGGAVERLYLDAESYLPARINALQTVGGFFGDVEIYLDDWREVDGVKYPFSLTFSFSSPKKLTLSITIKEILHNVKLDANIFEQP